MSFDGRAIAHPLTLPRHLISETTYVPGFYKIFDEILVNAADNKVSEQPVQTRSARKKLIVCALGRFAMKQWTRSKSQ